VEAEIAVVGVGVVPNVDFLTDSGLTLADGVVVDQRFQTQARGVFAAGDVANFFDPLYGRQRRIEHWSNANYQGTEVGKVLAGTGAGYDTVSSFFTEVFGTTVKVFGDVTRFDEQTTEGSLTSGTLLITYGDGGRLAGALTVGASDELEVVLNGLIAEHAAMGALQRELVGGRSQ
jgi:NADPH-dependent 2,4-dienoyl-CoA reductase/sulfur reductase-like enzyme